MVTAAALKLQQVEHRRKQEALNFGPAAPSFILIAFAPPVAPMILNAVHNDTPLLNERTMAALSGWDGKNLPDEIVYAPGRCG